jgi:hypothetical protein
MGTERGHRTLVITRKGGKVVTIRLAPRTARAIDLATGERTDGPLFLAADGKRLDRHGAAPIVRRVTVRAAAEAAQQAALSRQWRGRGRRLGELPADGIVVVGPSAAAEEVLTQATRWRAGPSASRRSAPRPQPPSTPYRHVTG